LNSVKRPVRNTLFLTGFFILAVSILGCNQRPTSSAFTGQTMGTTYHITISRDNNITSSELKQTEIDALLLAVNRSFSTYIDSSEVSTFNQYKGTQGQLKSADFIGLLIEAQRINSLTAGAYDITVGPLVNLWGFGPEFKEENIPSNEAIEQALSNVGFGNISVDVEASQVRKLKPDVYVDFSSIAKGYGVDRVARLIESKGYTNYMVEIGGEMRVKGHNQEGNRWRIAIEKPDSAARAIHRVINVTNVAMATSGDYRNFFLKDGVQFTHTIDPKTGWPVQHNLASVTVLHESTAIADALATAFMVLGDKKGYDLAMKNELAVLFLVKQDDGFKELQTPSFKKFIEAHK
jgi:thiamine biosynthesis lipoprotein